MIPWVTRAYGYTYDKSNRLTKADFNQQNTISSIAPWEKNLVNFTVDNLGYDANGNISSMKQMGLSASAIITLDNLHYNYNNHSNTLKNVWDGANITTSTLGDFKEPTANNSSNQGAPTTDFDYTYDPNGSLQIDKNKDIAGITYNHLNLPQQITITGKGTISYLYDAGGNKLRKTVTDISVSPSKTTITDYIGGFVYQQDTLQFVSHEEGRIRTVFKAGSPQAWAYDYFEKDHLGNIRIVLTEQSDFSMYLASMEQESAAKETTLFSNVESSRSAKPAGYPEDNSATKTNSSVAKLNATNPDKKIGPSLVIKVMAGDTIRIGARAFYKSQGPVQNKKVQPAEDMVTALAAAFGNGGSSTPGVHASRSSNNTPFTSDFYNNEYQHLKEKDPQENITGRPKAYLNFVLFDEQFKLVDENSGVKQVKAEPDQLQTLAQDKTVIKQSGFLYIYTSNESPQDVFFDNVILEHITGPVLEETHYYPFGLTMSGISSKAIGKLENKLGYNGKELQNKEFSTGEGLDLYDYGARFYDQQIGRWHKTDNKAELYFATSPYVYALNQPTNAVDPDGNLVIFINGFTPSAKERGTAEYWRTSWTTSKTAYRITRFASDPRGNQGDWFTTTTKHSLAFDVAVMNHLGDHKAIYRDGSLGGQWGLWLGYNTDPFARQSAGSQRGIEDAESIIANLARDKNGNITESIKIISHSMGGAYSKGYAQAILDYAKYNQIEGVKIDFEIDFAPFQSKSQKAVRGKGMGPTIQFSHDDDMVAGNFPMPGAIQANTKGDKDQSHSIFSFMNQITNLPAGNYKVVDGKIVPAN